MIRNRIRGFDWCINKFKLKPNIFWEIFTIFIFLFVAFFYTSNTDWKKLNNLAVHNVKHISMEHIRKALINAGFVDNNIKEEQTTLNDRPFSIINQNCEREAC